MNLFAVLALNDVRLTPEASKVHLASWNGDANPLQVYFEGWFDTWQSYQSKLNFSKPFVISLIQLPERDRWLFVGAHAVVNVAWDDERQEHKYETVPVQACSELAGRLVVSHARTGRQAYLLGSSCADRLAVHALLPEAMQFEEFPGFKKVDLEWPDLAIICRHNTTSWRTALSNVAGVYLISDPTDGKLYVGSATGEGGIWGRWSQYVDGHGNNVELFQLVGRQGLERARVFRFSILEIADVHASQAEILERESHWKRVLLTRTHGYNAN